MTEMLLIILLAAIFASISVNVYQRIRIKRERIEKAAFITKAAILENKVERLTTVCDCALKWNHIRKWKEVDNG